SVPHRLVVPGVAEGVDVSGRDTVVEDAVVVSGEGALAAGNHLHVVLGGARVVDTRLLREGTRKRHAAPALDEPRRGHALGRRDEVHGAALIVLPPAPPVATLADPRAHFLLRRQRTSSHAIPPGTGVRSLITCTASEERGQTRYGQPAASP